MREPIQILLDRMETHPHEFIEKYDADYSSDNDFNLFGQKTKWEKLVEHYKQFMTDEEKKVLLAKLSELNMATFKENFTKQLLADEKEQEETFSKGKAKELMKALAQHHQKRQTKQGNNLLVSQQQYEALKMATKGRYKK